MPSVFITSSEHAAALVASQSCVVRLSIATPRSSLLCSAVSMTVSVPLRRLSPNWATWVDWAGLRSKALIDCRT